MLSFGVHAADQSCTALQALKLKDTTLTVAVIEPSPHWSVESDALTRGAVSVSEPFCRVQGRIEKEIEFEVWLPPSSRWNGKHLGVGNGGYAGFINYSSLAQGLKRGYATASTDTGHKGGPMDASWALGHRQRIEDYGGRAQHLTAAATKQILKAYYSRPARYSYFMGCSNGGQQGLTAAQRYPEDYDGVVSGAPGTSFPDMSTYVMLSGRANGGAAAGRLTQQEMEFAVGRMVAACDKNDGVEDGLIENPPSCKFDFASLACTGAEQGQCLSKPQVENLRGLFSPLRDATGKEIYPPPAVGALLPASELERRGKLGADMYRYAVFQDTKWDPSSFVLERDLPIARERLKALISDDTDLTPFASRNSRLILYHGWDDSGPSPYNSINYYQAVQRKVGEQKADGFFRLFMVPGMYHCRGGPGPNSFGNAGDPPVLDAQHDVLMALEQWVERGAAPERIIASNVKAGRVERSRPLCPYPKVARYKGAGSIDEAENFSCVAP
ncbi:MAG TPA: tannase/feruloyl esterase family alpha/beta hydrolase [Steroidobacter sp.]